jgi:hypothetical protein
MIIFPRA